LSDSIDKNRIALLPGSARPEAHDPSPHRIRQLRCGNVPFVASHVQHGPAASFEDELLRESDPPGRVSTFGDQPSDRCLGALREGDDRPTPRSERWNCPDRALVEDLRESTRCIQVPNVRWLLKSLTGTPREVDEVITHIGKVISTKGVDAHLVGEEDKRTVACAAERPTLLAMNDMVTIEAKHALDELLERRRRADAHIEEVQDAQREAVAAAQVASETLTELERRALSGEKVAAAERRRAEEALVTARAEADAPWAERLAAAEAHRRDVDREYQQLVAENLSELVGEREEAGRRAAQRMNEAAATILNVYAEREGIASQITTLAAATGRVRPGAVTRTRAEQLAQAAQALLGGGGEAEPKLMIDLREPVHGQRLAPTL
jgi:hypothetical protein